MMVRSFIFIILLFLLPVTFYTQNWMPLGSGMNGQVTALTVYNGELIAGGNFTNAGGVPVNSIAKWNGTAWSPLGSGIIGDVRALIVYNNELIAGGYFYTAGGVSANCIAKWNGSAWSQIGSGMNSYVTSLTLYGNELVAGGFFSTAGGVPASAIAHWNGSSWAAYGNGMPYLVNSVASVNDSLFLGGNFFQTYRNTGKWTGSGWIAIGNGGCNAEVKSLTKFGTDLILGGYFSGAGPVSASFIVRWTGAQFIQMGSGMNQYVNCLTAADSFVIAGGNFTTAGGVPANRIAKWKNNWQPMGNGFNSEVYALTVYGGDIIAGGLFTQSGSAGLSYIARYPHVTGLNNISSNVPEKFHLQQNYPNPFNPSTTIRFDLKEKGNTKLMILDAAGKEVFNLLLSELSAGSYEYNWDASAFSSGIYFCKIISKSYTKTIKMVLIK